MKNKILLISSLLLSTNISFAYNNQLEKENAIKKFNQKNSSIEEVTKAIITFEKYSKDDPEMLFYLGKANYEKRNSYLKLDKEKGLLFMERAAVLGDANAQLFYGDYLINKDKKKAVALIESAAKKNNANAQYKLGKMYYLGKNVNKNKSIGFKLIKAAAEKNQKDAQYDLAKILFSQNNTNIQKQGVEWLEKSVKNQNYKSCDDLYKIYYSGLLVNKNVKKHINYLKCSALNNKDIAATNLLASYYKNGKFVNKDLNSAKYLYKGVAENNKTTNSEAIINYAKIILSSPDSKDKELDNAIKYLEKAASKDNEAALILGDIFSVGYKGILRDKPKAIEYYQLAQNNGSLTAQEKLEKILK